MRTWKIVAHSLKGKKPGRNCQDRWTHFVGKDGKRARAAFVVADGAGSCARAEDGAKRAVKAVGSELIAWVHLLSDNLINSSFRDSLRQELQPEMQSAFTLLDAQMRKEEPNRPNVFGTSVTAVVPGLEWLACISEGDVACISGSPGRWTLVNRILKGTPNSSAGPKRNRTTLLPYRDTPDPKNPPTSSFSLIRRKPGDLILIFSDGAIRRFLVDTTPQALEGTYVINTQALDGFYAQLKMRLCPASLEPRKSGWLPAWITGSRLWPFGDSTLPAAPLHPETADNWLAQFVARIADEGEPDDITILAAIDVE